MPALADIKLAVRRLAARQPGRTPILRVSVVAGAAADTNIAISGIERDDVILSALQVEPDNGTAATMLTDITSEVAITSAGNIQVDTTVTTGKQILVIWLQKV